MGAPLQTVEPWLPLSLKAADLPWPERSNALRLELNVEQSPRYAPRDDGSTFCNIYATDFIAGMGVAAPRHWMMSTGDPAAVGKGLEMSANRLYDWFEEHSARYGWMAADSVTAQNAAERGHVVVVCWKNPTRRPGHIAVVVGRDRISQAGGTNHFVCTVRMGFGRVADDKGLKYFVQMDRPGGHNG